ncbi:MAG TPA: hypothetical protein VLE95_04450 [Chlamydiales bacterium]|nr:hypothetical protein [Chlamydiales bacterium]
MARLTDEELAERMRRVDGDIERQAASTALDLFKERITAKTPGAKVIKFEKGTPRDKPPKDKKPGPKK